MIMMNREGSQHPACSRLSRVLRLKKKSRGIIFKVCSLSLMLSALLFMPKLKFLHGDR